MSSGIADVPRDILLIILGNIDGRDVRSFGNTCRRFRSFIIANRTKLNEEILLWPSAYLEFGRKITLKRSCPSQEGHRRRRASEMKSSWEFREDVFLREFANLFFVVVPGVMYVKCKDLDEHVAEIVRKCVGVLWGKTLALEMDKCSLGENGLRRFLEHFSPFFLHLAGHFNRSLISDEVLPLSSLFSLFIGLNRADFDTRTRISGITVRKIVNNWFQRYPDVFATNSSLRHIENYEGREFRVEIPDCDLDYNEFFAFLKELMLFPRRTNERIVIHNLPKTLIHTVYRNVNELPTFGPVVWFQQGLCTPDDVIWSCGLACECDIMSMTHRDYLTPGNIPQDPTGLCDTVGLCLRITASTFEEVLQSRKPLLQVLISLKANQMSSEKIIPERSYVDSRKRRNSERNIPSLYTFMFLQ